MGLQERLEEDFDRLLTDTTRATQVNIQYKYNTRTVTPSTGVVSTTTTTVTTVAIREKIVSQLKSPDGSIVTKIETVFFVKKSALTTPPRKGDSIICSSVTFDVVTYVCDTTDIYYRVFTGILP